MKERGFENNRKNEGQEQSQDRNNSFGSFRQSSLPVDLKWTIRRNMRRISRDGR